MSSYTYTPFDPTPVVLGGLPAYSREITVASGANASGSVLPRGTVLGAVTATGKFITSVEAASDGSQTPRCILVDDVDASAGDVTTNGYYIGVFASEKLTYGTGHSITTVNNAFASSGQPVFIRDVGTVS